MEKKRERGENWTQEEKELFIQIMRDSSAIIENKNTDTNANKQKQAEWRNIQKKMQELGGKLREITQLKGFWRRIKISAKKNISQNRKACKATGGGQKPPSPSEEDKIIMDICPTDFVIEDNEFDSDGIYVKKADQIVVQNEEPVMVNKTEDGIIKHDEHIFMENNVKNGEIIIFDTEYREGNTMTERTPQFMGNTSKIDEMKTPQKYRKEKCTRVNKNNKATIFENNIEIKQRSMNLIEEEYSLKIQYQKRELSHQELRHKLEISLLMLKKEKEELEIAILKKKLTSEQL